MSSSIGGSCRRSNKIGTYLKALAVAEQRTSSAAQMAEVLRRFSSYGRSLRL